MGIPTQLIVFYLRLSSLLPPAFRILSRAFSVTRRAHRVILGTSKILRIDICQFSSSYKTVKNYHKDRWKPQIVGNSANADSKLAGIALLLQVPHKTSQREWGTVDPGRKVLYTVTSSANTIPFTKPKTGQWSLRHILAHKKPPQDDFVELSISPSGQEPEKYGLSL